MTRILDACLNKVITAWSITPGVLDFELDDEHTFHIEAAIDSDGDLDLHCGFETDDEDEQPSLPTVEGKYTALADSVKNVYSHKVELNNVTGALYCEGCYRENHELAKEPCDA